ncbi:MAG: hypothetical protein HZA52_18040 [Planctomycetes bacterium]|nr:hypothetical protein [Planctomycetota bacterium]
MQTERRPVGCLEFVAVIVLIAAAFLPRVRDLDAPFDREFEGAQGAFFTIAAINYDRLGVGAFGGYPVLNIDLDETRPDTWYTYENHPPTVPLFTLAGLRVLGPLDWNERYGTRGAEWAVRVPFLVLHFFFLLAFWWMLREASDGVSALLGLLVAAALPVLTIYAPLANYETPALLALALAYGSYARLVRWGKTPDLVALLVFFALGGVVTWAPLFFVPPLAVHAWRRVGLANGARLGALCAAATLVPLVLHTALARSALAAIGREPAGLDDRAQALLEPLFSGAHPPTEWLALQVERLWAWCSPLALGLAAVGLVLAAFETRRNRERRDTPIGVLWLCGGATYLFAFYRHTLDAQHTFLMLVAPAIAVLAGRALAKPISLWVKGSVGAIVASVATATVVVLALQRTDDFRYRFRAQENAPSRAGVAAPELPPMDKLGFELRSLTPAGSFVVFPEALGLNYAAYYYAWRTLWPIRSPDDTLPFAVAKRFLPNGSMLLVLPKSVPASARESVEALRARYCTGEPVRESANFTAWPLD